MNGVKEQATYVWGLSIFYKRSNPYKKRWKVGENGEWEFKNRREALRSIDGDMGPCIAKMKSGEHITVKGHKSLPKYAAARFTQTKLQQILDDMPLPLPGSILEPYLLFKLNRESLIYEEI